MPMPFLEMKNVAKNYINLYEHTMDWPSILVDGIYNNTETRGQDIVGCGGAKTTDMRLAIEVQLTADPISWIVAGSPRLNLNDQTLLEIIGARPAFNMLLLTKKYPLDLLIVSSYTGLSDSNATYTDGNGNNQPITNETSIIGIKQRMVDSYNKKSALLMFGVYDSLSKLIIEKARVLACEEIGIEKPFSLFLADEAHNVVSLAYNNVVQTDKFTCERYVFFTATRKITKELSGTGMRNILLYGKVLRYISTEYLISKGITLPIKLKIISAMSYKLFKQEKDREKAKALATVASSAVGEFKNNPKFSLLISCDSATNAIELANSKLLREVIEGEIGEEINIVGIIAGEEVNNNVLTKNKRQQAIELIATDKPSIMFHFDVVSEGFNMPSLTSLLPMRHLAFIKTIQSIGRISRLTDIDKENLRNGTISVGNPTGWELPYANIYLVVFQDDEYNDIIAELKNRLSVMVDDGIGIEGMEVYVEFADEGKRSKTDPNLRTPHEENIFDLLKKKGTIKKIISDVINEAEYEEHVYAVSEKTGSIARPLTNFLSFLKKLS